MMMMTMIRTMIKPSVENTKFCSPLEYFRNTGAYNEHSNIFFIVKFKIFARKSGCNLKSFIKQNKTNKKENYKKHILLGKGVKKERIFQIS